MKKLDYTTSTAFLRDSFVPFREANISIGSSPVLYGLAIYTVFGITAGADGSLLAFRLEDHWNRLVNSARIMGFNTFPGVWNFEKFKQMITELSAKNEVAENVLVRVTVFIDANLAGTKIHNLPTSMSAYVYPLGEILPRTGAQVCLSKWQRVSSKAIPVRAKVNGSYVNSALMKNEAMLAGFDDALAQDEKGNICEGTVANVFFVKNGELHTPSVEFDMLEGITRRSIIEIARDIGIVMHERAILKDEIHDFDEAFFCGSSARITPILSIDSKKVGKGTTGPLTEKLQERYSRITSGLDSAYQKWLTRVK
jgi:branched-chain amino acid aminotransferase